MIISWLLKDFHQTWGDVGCGIAMVLLVGFVYCAIQEGCQALFGKKERTSVAEAQNAADEPIPDWHKAETKLEVALRIRDRLVGELKSLGLDASDIVANAKSHPTRLMARVPEHKRTRLLVLSREDERVITKAFVDEYRKEGLLAENSAATERIRGIVERLIAVVPEIDAVPEIFILRDDSVNACCLPDGTVFVNTGTLESVGDDDMLAAILAHELGHAAARHSNEGVTLALEGEATGVVVEELAARYAKVLNSGTGVSIVRCVYGLGTTVGVELPRNRTQESEADRLGVRYLARAGFDPEAMERFFHWVEEIAPDDRSVFAQLFATHPLTQDRIEHVREVLQEPDLREMPKKGLLGRIKDKADATDFTELHPVATATNAMAGWKARKKGGEAAESAPETKVEASETEENVTNAAERLPKMTKWPWKRKGEPGKKDGERHPTVDN